MKLRLTATLLLALALAPSAAAATFRAVITTSSHAPAVNAKWPYQVHVTDSHGKPLRATVTMQVVDPFGGVHPVAFGCCKTIVRSHPFTGIFRDYMRFPPESKGFRLTVRAIVVVKGVRVVATSWVKSV